MEEDFLREEANLKQSLDDFHARLLEVGQFPKQRSQLS